MVPDMLSRGKISWGTQPTAENPPVRFPRIRNAGQPQMKNALTASQAQLAEILEIAPEAIIVIDESHRITVFNRGAERIFGHQAEHMIGRPLNDLIPEPYRRAHDRHMEEFATDPEDSRLMDARREISGLRKDGTVFPAEASISKQEIDGKRYFTVMLRDITARKRTADKLRESEARLRDAVDTISDGFAYYDADERLVLSNSCYAEHVHGPAFIGPGVRFEEVVRHIVEIGSIPEADGREEEWIAERLAKFRDPRGPIEQRLADGRWLQISERKTDGGGTVAILTDITERKRAEETVRQSEENYRNLIESALQGIFIHRGDEPLFANRAVAQMFGYSTVDEVMALESLDLLYAADERQRLKGFLEARLRGEEVPDVYEFRGLRKDGREIWLQRTSQTITWAGEPAVRGMVIDVTERKRAETRLRAVAEAVSSASGMALFDHLAESLASILHLDFAFIGRLIDADKTGIRTLSFYADGAKLGNFEYDLAGTPCENVVGKQTCVFENSVQDEFPDDDDLKELGVESYVGMPLFSSDGEALGLIVGMNRQPLDTARVALDLMHIFAVRAAAELEREQSAEELQAALIDAEQANQAKSEFLATMSHELRTPLNAIVGFAEILGHRYVQPLSEEKNREYADDIHASSQHLLALVNDILDLSAIESGERALGREPLALVDIVDDCSRIVADQVAGKAIRYRTDVPDLLETLHADRRAVKQIVLNLLSNSVKFTPEGGAIDLSASTAEGRHRLVVRDTGKGVPAAEIDNLTDPFHRLEADPYVTQEGTGLGLAIVKSRVDLHGGELDIESEPDVGTTVTVSLPSRPP